MDDDRSVSEERGGALLGGGVEVEVGGLEGSGAGDFAVLACEVADLAGCRFGGVAGGHFAALVGVEMGEGGGAVSGGGDGLVVDVVDWEVKCQYGWFDGRVGVVDRWIVSLTEWTKRRVGEAVEVDIPHDAGAVRVRGSSDLATDVGGGSVGEDGLVGDTGGILGGDGRIAEFAGRLSESDCGEKGGGDN